MRKASVLMVLVVLSSVIVAQQKIDSKFGKGLYNVIAEDSSWSMNFSARFQSLYIGEWTVNSSDGIQGPGSSEFLIRRARLKFGGFVYSPKVQYKIELGLSNKDLGKVNSRNNLAPNMILDAVIKWNFYKNFTIWAGQTKLPGNRERVISSGNLQFVDRSLLNKRFNIDRDMGFQLRNHHKLGKKMVIKEILSLAQGEGRNLVQENLGGYQYTGRMEFLPFGSFKSKGDYSGSDLKREEEPKLAIGVSYDYNDRAVKDQANLGSYMTYDLDGNGSDDGYFENTTYTLFVDAMFKYKGFSFMGEYADRTSEHDELSVMNLDSSTTTKRVYQGNGMNLSLGYLFNNNWELAGRYTQINPKAITGKASHTQYTLGLSKYVVGHKLKVQTDVSYMTTDGSADSDLMYRFQIDLHF